MSVGRPPDGTPGSPSPGKVCPVVFRVVAGVRQVLAFEHPRAGLQLVKGTIEPGEGLQAAAVRELAEESGITGATPGAILGIWPSGHEGHVWAFVPCTPATPLPDAWVHHAPDDGGHRFRFFWHPLHEVPDPRRWHAVFRGALRYLVEAR